MHIWGCPAKTGPYRLNERKLDSRTIDCYFIGYYDRAMGYKVYDPTTKAIFETINGQFSEDVKFGGGR